MTRQSPGVGDESRVYAIGDIHGRRDLLLRLLEMIYDDAIGRRDARHLHFVFLGDYIDRGDETAHVLATLRVLATDAADQVTLLRGNHEAALLAFLNDPIAGAGWLDYGAQQTLASYGIDIPPNAPPESALLRTRDALAASMGEDIELLQNMPSQAVIGDAIFTHAGGNPVNGDITEDGLAMLWGHPAGLTNNPIPGKLLVHGHYDDDEPVQCAGRICVDTGAYYSGQLTAVRLDEGIGFLCARL